MADREPIAGTSRPSGDMPSDRPPLASSHSSHDLVLLAAAADRDAEPSVRAAAADQAGGCAECAALAAELCAIAAGLAELPEARPVPRDMRITAAQAARLRRGSLWRRLLQPFGPEGLAALRPIAATLTTLGLAGLLLMALPLNFGLGGAAVLSTVGSAVHQGDGTPGEAPVPAALSTPGAAAQGGDKSLASTPPRGPETAPTNDFGAGAGGDTERLSGSPSQPPPGVELPQLSPVTWLSLALVAVGLGLLALRFLARRLG